MFKTHQDGTRVQVVRLMLLCHHLPCLDQDIENSYFTVMCSGSEAGSYLRLIDFVYHSTLGLRVVKKKKGDMKIIGYGSGFKVQVVRLMLLCHHLPSIHQDRTHRLWASTRTHRL